MIGGLGWQELLIVLVIIMIVFGAGKLPDVARSLGQGVKEFKKEANSPESAIASSKAAAPQAAEDSLTRVETAQVRAEEI
jgi:sec-independent protein translocase protein TatA